MRRARVALMLWSLALGSLVTGCTTLFDEGLIRDETDSGPPACGALEPPPRPGGADTPSVSELVFAVRGIQLEGEEMWRATGRNLDGFCTDSQVGITECRPPAFDGEGSELVDGFAGIDNGYGRSVPAIATLEPDFTTSVDNSYERGIGSMLLIIRRWNGTDTDPRVEVRFATATAITRDPPLPDSGIPYRFLDGGAVLGPPEIPRWNGLDSAWAGADDFIGGDLRQAVIEDPNAYVADNTLVARPRPPRELDGGPPVPEDMTIRIGGMHLRDVTVTARITADGERLADVIVSGRWPVNRLVQAAADACFDADRVRLLTNLLNRSADVRAEAGTGGDGVTCDALSVGLRYNVARVELVGLAPSEPAVPPFPDSCDGTPRPVDAGMRDAGPPEAGVPDAGMDGG